MHQPGRGRAGFQNALREAGIESLEHGRTRYTSNAGLKELRAEITRYLARRMNLHYEPSQVLVTVGGSEAIDMCIRTLVQPGDEGGPADRRMRSASKQTLSKRPLPPRPSWSSCRSPTTPRVP